MIIYLEGMPMCWSLSQCLGNTLDRWWVQHRQLYMSIIK